MNADEAKQIVENAADMSFAVAESLLGAFFVPNIGICPEPLERPDRIDP